MEELLKNIKNKYEELNKKINELTLEEEGLKEEHNILMDEYNLCNKAYSDSCDTYIKFNNKIEGKKRKYVKKKNSRHINLVMLTTLLICLTIAGINIELGLIANKFSACMGCLIFSAVTGIIDINVFYDKLTKKYEKEFDELDSTKKAEETLDKFYVKKLRNEKQLNDSKTKIMEHSKKISDVARERNRTEKEIDDLKFKFFNKIFGELDVNKSEITNNDTMQIDELSQKQNGKELTKKLTPSKNK